MMALVIVVSWCPYEDIWTMRDKKCIVHSLVIYVVTMSGDWKN